jgi:DNA-binding NtrC family response regulator
MTSQRRLRSVPSNTKSGHVADVAASLGELASNSEFKWLREIAQVVLSGLKSCEQVATEGDVKLNFKQRVGEFESRLIRDALIRTRGNQRRAALALGIKFSTLNTKIKRYGIEVTSFPVESEVEDSPKLGRQKSNRRLK